MTSAVHVKETTSTEPEQQDEDAQRYSQVGQNWYRKNPHNIIGDKCKNG